MDDPQNASEIMSSWCMCEWRVGGVEWRVECGVFGVWWFAPMLNADDGLVLNECARRLAL